MQTVSLANFDQVFTYLLQTKTRAIVLFTSQANQDGTYWCPDCQAIKPIYTVLHEQAKKVNLPLYVFIVGDRYTWKDPENKFRTNKFTLIKSVPTLGLFDGKQVVRKIVEAEIFSQEQRNLVYQ